MSRATVTGRWPRIFAVISGVNVRTKILGIILALTFILGLAVTLQVRAIMTQTLLAEVDGRGRSLVSDLVGRSETYLSGGELSDLHTLLADTVANHPDARYAFVVTSDGQVMAHTFGDQVPASLLTLMPTQPGDDRNHQHYENIEGIVHDFSLPIQGNDLGEIRLGLNESRVQDIVNGVTQRMLLTTALVALVGILAASLLTWLLTRPILDLVSATEQLRAGDLDTRAPHWTNDEIGDLADAFNRMVVDLEVSQRSVDEKEEARTHLLSRLIGAQEEERKRIARELHDDVGQSLTSILVGMQVLAQMERIEWVRNKVGELRVVATDALQTVRLLSRQLRPSALDDLGLSAALERYAGEFSSLFPALEVDLHCHLDARLPSNIEISLYRIIQEAMTNAARHSGASSLSVLVSARSSAVQAIIEDNGCGFDVELVRRSGSSVGIYSMAERCELLDGHLDIESGADGTTVYVDIPLTG